jgi:hypothetical protein
MKRQRRDKRRRGVEVRLTPRDQSLIQAIARFRIADTGSLLRVSFDGIRRDTAIRRLRLLYDAGWLDLRVPGRDEENLYFLGHRGRAWMEMKGLSASGAPRGPIEHHLGIVRAWAAVASHGIEGLEVVRSYPDWELREKFGAAGSEVVPDLLVAFRINGRTVPLAIEVDLGTESLRTLSDKLRRYEQLRGDAGGLFRAGDFGLGFALGDRHRERQIYELLETEWSGWSLVWCDPSEFREAFAAALAAFSPPLTISPCHKGRAASATGDGPTPSDLDDTGL